MAAPLLALAPQRSPRPSPPALFPLLGLPRQEGRCWAQGASTSPALPPSCPGPWRVPPASHACVPGLAAAWPCGERSVGPEAAADEPLRGGTCSLGLLSVDSSPGLLFLRPQPPPPPANLYSAPRHPLSFGGPRKCLVIMYEPEPREFVRTCDV